MLPNKDLAAIPFGVEIDKVTFGLQNLGKNFEKELNFPPSPAD